MAVETTKTVFDTQGIIRPGLSVVTYADEIAKMQNWCYANLRPAVICQDFNRTADGQGMIWQGVDSDVDSTEGSYVARLEVLYDTRALPDNVDYLVMVTEAEATTNDGKVRVVFDDSGTTTIESTHTAGSVTTVSTTVSSSGLDGDSLYVGTVSLRAGTSGYIKLLRLAIYEVTIADGDLP